MSDLGEFHSMVRAFRTSLEQMERKGSLHLPVGTIQESPLLALDAIVPDSRTKMGPPSAAEITVSPGVSQPHQMPASAPQQEPQVSTQASATDANTAKSLTQIRDELGDCQRCPLSVTRKQIVFGAGAQSARLLFVGEAPGASEDAEGVPFVGPAGQLLDKMIVAMGFSRNSVYIANVLKCRPPGNRDPRAEEITACEGVLAAQIKTIAPEVIVTLGKPAAHLLLQTKANMGALRGKWQLYRDIPVMPTYHPAYLLRDASKKRDAWSDLQQVMARLQAG